MGVGALTWGKQPHPLLKIKFNIQKRGTMGDLFEAYSPTPSQKLNWKSKKL